MADLRAIKWPCKQKGVYWAPTGTVDQFGQKSFATPVSIKCRWDEHEIEELMTNGRNISYSSTVITDRRCVSEGFLMLGDIANYPGITNNPLSYNALRIQETRVTPDVDCREALYEALL